MKNRNIILTTILLTLGSFALPSGTQAVVPPPDGGYPGQNTAEGQSALLHLGAGTYNTALGWASLGFNVTGDFNTAVGAATLLNNTSDQNTATGAGALLSNTNGSDNTANGVFALFNNTIGHDNTANGFQALLGNLGGSDNTAIGRGALENNLNGNSNIAVGSFAGENVISANNVICIGTDGNNENDSCYIGNIFSSTVSASAVFVNSNGRLGTMTSSKRFKQDIKPMDNVSEALYSLKPVSFRYKKEFDPAGASQLGLVAEDVDKVDPDLVVRDKEGKAYSVRYEQVNAMLLNEFLKEHKRVEDLNAKAATQDATITESKSMVVTQEAMIVRQQKAMEAFAVQLKEQDAKLQKVSAQVQTNKAAPQMVVNP